jgi:hypothetical protein
MGPLVVQPHRYIQNVYQRTKTVHWTDLSGRGTPMVSERCVCACYPENSVSQADVSSSKDRRDSVSIRFGVS